MDFPIVANAFRGIQVGVGLIILRAGYNMFKKMKKNAFTITILLVALLAMLTINFLSLNFSTIYLLLLAGVIGFTFYYIKKLISGKKVES